MLKPTLEELDEKCPLHPDTNMLMYIDEPNRSKIGKFCPLCPIQWMSQCKVPAHEHGHGGERR